MTCCARNGARLAGDRARAMLPVAFDIQRKDRIVQRKAQEEPAVAVRFIEIYAHALAVVRRDAPAGLLLRVLRKRIKHRCARGAEVLRKDLQPELTALDRLVKPFEQALERAPRGDLHQKAGDEIRAIVKEIILLERGVAGGLNGELAVLPRGVEPQRLVDDVAVAAAEAAVHAAVRGDKLRKPVDVMESVTIAVPGCSRSSMAEMSAMRRLRLSSSPFESTAPARSTSVSKMTPKSAWLSSTASQVLSIARQLGVRHMLGKQPVGVRVAAAGRVPAAREGRARARRKSRPAPFPASTTICLPARGFSFPFAAAMIFSRRMAA